MYAGLFYYEYGDEGVGTLAEDVDIDVNGFFCERCGESLYHNETHDCIECWGCGEFDMCLCEGGMDTMPVCQHCTKPESDCDCPHCEECGVNVREYNCYCQDEDDFDVDPWGRMAV